MPGVEVSSAPVRIPEFKLERYFARWEFKAPYLLCASDVEGFRLVELFAIAAGAEVTLVLLRADEGWRFDVGRLRRAVRPNTRLIVLNYPHSPAGEQLEPVELSELAGIAADARATLLSDEVYRFLEHDGMPPPVIGDSPQ